VVLILVHQWLLLPLLLLQLLCLALASFLAQPRRILATRFDRRHYKRQRRRG
jgi:hypothetical protein